MHEDPEPIAPIEPEPGDCCGEGCARCVLDIYDEELAHYRAEHARWQARRAGGTDSSTPAGRRRDGGAQS